MNVLGLAGGPTAAGSYRQIRVLRGGKLLHALDLYPLRAEGLGNMNLSFQNGDTIFVPMAYNQITLEGPFARVKALLPPPPAARSRNGPDADQVPGGEDPRGQTRPPKRP